MCMRSCRMRVDHVHIGLLCDHFVQCLRYSCILFIRVGTVLTFDATIADSSCKCSVTHLLRILVWPSGWTFTCASSCIDTW